MYDGPFFPGAHALILFAIAVFWLVAVAVILLAFYFVIRLAVTRGILRADELRGHAHASAHRHVPPAAPLQDDPRTAPVEDRRPDGTPPDVAA